MIDADIGTLLSIDGHHFFPVQSVGNATYLTVYF